MKNIYKILVSASLLVGVFLPQLALAQAPLQMSYQAIVRDANNKLVTSQNVGMRISILQTTINGTSVYTETQTSTSNTNGLVTLEIGTGTTTDNFASINWANGPYFIKTETDPTGGTNYTIAGTSQLLSVPYALYAKTAGNITGGFTETDPLFVASPANGISPANITSWNTAYGWGNPVGLYRPISYIPAWGEITSNPFSISTVANNQLLKYNSVSGKWENWTSNFLTSYTETDPIWTAAAANYYTKTNMQTNGTSQLHFGNITNKPTTLAGYGITDAQAAIAAGTNTQYWRGDKTWQTLDKTTVGLASVENTALSTWLGSANITMLGTVTTGVWNAGAVTSSGTITATKIVKSGGTASQFLKADGSVDANVYITAVREVADEFTATSSQSTFTLSQAPSATSKVKMYINGIRISNTAYNNTGTALTYVAANNGSFALIAGDRVQFDYTY